ncbi:unnamed protein product [Cochlearia groenlandica]
MVPTTRTSNESRRRPRPYGLHLSGSATPAPYVRRREDALLHASARRNQQHLHPQKLKGALWFCIDPEVHTFIKATWQGNFWGPWATWKDLPEEKTNLWLHAFIMVDEGLDEPPPYTALARKTHCGKDGSFLDERSEELVLEVEHAVEEMLQEGSPLGDNLTESSPSKFKAVSSQPRIHQGHFFSHLHFNS